LVWRKLEKSIINFKIKLEMENLNSLSVVELGQEEMVNTDGGVLPIIAAAVLIDYAAIALLGFTAGYVIND
jgi:lactobin A/cerein 7B family class IIb bacteriocin